MSLKNLNKIIKDDTDNILTITPEEEILFYCEADIRNTYDIIMFQWYQTLRDLFQPTED